MEADEIPEGCIQDPRFVKLLVASLCSEIAESKIILTELNTGIGQLKDNFSKECERRKLAKQSISQLDKKKRLLTDVLEGLDRTTRLRSIQIEAAKNRLDDGALRQVQERREFELILQNYEETWQKYKAQYEERPLAIERQRCRINVQRLDVQRMILEYKNVELMKIMKKRNEIDATRMKTLLVDISEMMLHRRKKEEYYERLKSTKEQMEKELAACTRQLSEMDQREIERQTITEDDDTPFMTPPPPLQFPLAFVFQQHQTGMKNLDHTSHDDLDTLSINTAMLEELCNEIPRDSTILGEKDRNILRCESLDKMPPPSSTVPSMPHPAVDISEESKVRDKLHGLAIIDNTNHSTVSKDNFDNTQERNMETDPHDATSYHSASNYDTSQSAKTMTPRGTTDEPKTNCITIDENSREEHNLSRNITKDPCELPPVLGQDQNSPSSIFNASMELAKSLRDVSSTVANKNCSDLKIFNEDECSKPKIRKIAASCDQDSRSPTKMEERVTEIETKRFTDAISPPTSVYKFSPNCASSNDLSNMLGEENWRKTLQASADTPLCDLSKKRNFAMLSNLEIWSPPQPQPRELSLIDDFAKSNNDGPTSQRLTSDNPGLDLAEFFKKTGNNSKTMF